MCEENKDKILQIAADVRKFEIGLFWQRSLFFWGLIAATFLAYANIKDTDPQLRFVIVCVGFIFSLGWTLVNRGSKYWQEAWETKTGRVEKAVLGIQLFHSREDVQKKFSLDFFPKYLPKFLQNVFKRFFPEILFWQAREYSVSKLAIALSDFTVATWFFLGVKSFHGWVTVLMAIATLGYAALMLSMGRTSRSRSN